jgi:hypothetical protein
MVSIEVTSHFRKSLRVSRPLDFCKSNFLILGWLKSQGYLKMLVLISPTHKRAEGRAPLWGSKFTTKAAH